MFQDEHGDDSAQEKIKKKMPRRVKKRRKVQTDDGVSIVVCQVTGCCVTIGSHATLGIGSNVGSITRPDPRERPEPRSNVASFDLIVFHLCCCRLVTREIKAVEKASKL